MGADIKEIKNNAKSERFIPTLYDKYAISTEIAIKSCEKMSYNKANSLNLPSKKLFLVALPIILLVGIFVMFHKPSSAESTKLSSANGGLQAVSVASQNVITETDSDGDGVPDWEETLWHTDPHNPATYNGEPDAQYIADQIKNQANPSTSNGPITSTEDMSKELFTEYLSLQQSGSLTQNDIDAMTARLAGSVAATSSASIYTAAEVTPFADNNSHAIQSYADTLAQTVNTYSAQYANLNNTIGAPTDNSFQNNVMVASDFYLKLSKAIIAINPPQSLAVAHVAYANSLKQSSVALQEFANSDSDPVGGIAGLNAHLQAQAAERSAVAQITSFLLQNGIISFSLPIL